MRIWVLTGILATTGACSLLVEPTTEVRCSTETGCPGGQVCEPIVVGAAEGVCRDICVPPGVPEECNGRDDDCDGSVDEGFGEVNELCNAIDDDCDGRIDEGNDLDGDGSILPNETFDRDGDGYNQCGTDQCLDPDNTCTINPDRIDCNDDDNSIHPDANEECDAIDHDCDSQATPDDLSSLDARCAGIAPGTICEPGLGCVANDCTAPRNACADEMLCDTTLDPPQCVMAGCSPEACAEAGQWCDPSSGECRARVGNGETCTVDAQCSSLVCLEPGAVRLPASLGDKICMEACCTDTDCPTDQFCWDGGNGARTCLPVDLAPSTTGRTTLGSLGPDAPCDQNNACRSGRCENGRCLSPCRHDSQCGSGQTCSLHEVLVAGSTRTVMACASGRLSVLDECRDSTECTTVCQSLIFYNVCRDETFCATDEDCSGGCNYATSPGELAQGVITLCTDGGPTDACCNNRQCGTNSVCRPQLGTGEGENWLMFCTPRPL